MHAIRASESVFPLVGCRSRPEGDFFLEELCGTAYYINNGNFVVAGHSLSKALEHEHPGLGRLHNDRWAHFEIADHEIVSGYDIGFVKAEVPDAKALKWDFSEQEPWTDVRTIGFPFGLDWEWVTLRSRALKGYIVSTFTYHRLPSSPRCYELSFSCPRGLSGAPIVAQRTVAIAGMVIANLTTEGKVFTEREIERSEEAKIVRERYEAIQFGIAIETGSVQDVQSAILGGSLSEYLRSVGLA